MDAPEGMPDGGVPFRVDVLFLEAVSTSDGRIFTAGGGATRALPWPLQATEESAHGGMPGGATNAGQISTVERYEAPEHGDGAYAWRAAGWFAPDDAGLRFARLAAEQRIDGISVDAAATIEEIEVIEEDEDGWPIEFLFRYPEWELMGATQVPFPAFAAARIIVDAEDLPGAEPLAASATPRDQLAGMPVTLLPRGPAGGLVAAASTDAPPAGWFDDPRLDGPTPLTVDDDGRVYGHIAAWHTRHLGFPDRPVYAPRSQSGYAYFHTGDLVTREGQHVAVGRVTVGGGHAPTAGPAADMRAALAHYDDAATTAAYVRAGEDEHGIWVAGTVAPGLDDLKLRQLRAHPPSGDWRPVGTASELIIAHCVNAPGFPVQRSAQVAGAGAPALVAAGYHALIVAAERRRPDQAAADAVRQAVDEALAPFRPLARHHAAQAHLTRIRQARTPRAPN